MPPLNCSIMKISIIIPTHNRHQQLLETIEKLRRQSFPAEDFEILVVDDGSNPPVTLPKEFTALPETSVIRLEGLERSVARNTGAANAKGELLVFIDDDITVGENFLADYWKAHLEFPDALFVGAILLPEESQKTPFGRFRQNLENDGVPAVRGEIAAKNFCAAGNMAINSSIFKRISGFDATLTSGEDQDFALRHTAQGEKIVFVPEARGIHLDNALSIRAYCRRNEWGSRLMLPFCRRYPELPANIERERINGEIRWAEDPVSLTSRKIIKSLIASPVVVKPLFLITDVLEKLSPKSSLLERSYQLLLGAHIFRGYRAAIKQSKEKASSQITLK